jgi:hypothetical protein
VEVGKRNTHEERLVLISLCPYLILVHGPGKQIIAELNIITLCVVSLHWLVVRLVHNTISASKIL